MKILLFVIALCVYMCATENTEDIFSTNLESCDFTENVVEDYLYAQYSVAIAMFKRIFFNKLTHFSYSPLSAWIHLAAIAEGTDIDTKLAMFHELSLPIDPCIRLKYYQLATSRYPHSDDVLISNTRALVIDEGVTINPVYHNFVFHNSLLDVVSAPIRDDPETALREIRRVTAAKLPHLDLSGNSVILDTMDYNGLWSTAFEDAVIVRSPFYSQTGEQIGAVDLMKIKRRVRWGYFAELNLNAIELPIGQDDRYRMIFGLIVRDNKVDNTITTLRTSVAIEFLKRFKESAGPIDIAIPRLDITSEHDLRGILEDYGAQNLGTDPNITRFISEPAALPSAFVQRSTISLNNAGLRPVSAEHRSQGKAKALDPNAFQEFIANKPFLIGLFDAETYTCLMSGAFTQPTYTE